MISIENLVKRHGSREVLHGVSLEARPGRVTGFVGPNGAGKSTSLEMTVGLRTPDSGTVRTLGLDPRTARDELSRRVAIQPQEAKIFEYLRVGELVELWSSFYDRPRPAGEILDSLELTKFVKRQVTKLSGGTLQRLNVALAMVSDPELLILDEPSTGLDPRAIHFFWDTLAELRDRGLTIVLTSHILAELQNRVDRVAVMANGRIQALGSLTELRAGFDLPLHMQIQLKPGTDAAAMLCWLQALFDELATLPVREHRATGSVVIDVPHRHKMRLLQHLLSAQEYVADIQVQEPSLEDMFFASPDDQAARNTPASAGTPDRQPTTPQTSTGGQA